MPSYRLAKSAEEDLTAIAHYGDEYFGIAQSDYYRDQLRQRFSLLAERPFLYPAVDHIQEGYRRSVCGVNVIYYRIEGDTVEIIRVLGQQNLDDAFG